MSDRMPLSRDLSRYIRRFPLLLLPLPSTTCAAHKDLNLAAACYVASDPYLPVSLDVVPPFTTINYHCFADFTTT